MNNYNENQLAIARDQIELIRLLLGNNCDVLLLKKYVDQGLFTVVPMSIMVRRVADGVIPSEKHMVGYLASTSQFWNTAVELNNTDIICQNIANL
jgi:hypothetical protein